MSKLVFIKSLHLEYRLWIAELNFDINLIRIFNDRLIEIADENKTPEILADIENFENQLNHKRENIDSLRHRMHIEKMNLAAIARENTKPGFQIATPENYSAIRSDFFKFRVLFDELKDQFLHFEDSSS